MEALIEYLAVNRKRSQEKGTNKIPVSGKGYKSGLIAWHPNQQAPEEGPAYPGLRQGESLLMSSWTWEHQEEEIASLT